MDIFSAASRLSKPFEFQEGRVAPLPIEAHGLIGDGASCALVRPDGVIDWLCLPRFDSPSVFAALLDLEHGGLTAVRPRAGFESVQQYDPETNVLETLFRVPGQGVARLTDFMPWSDDPRAAIHEVHRRIDCREGAIELEAIFDPRFDYGRARPEISFGGPSALATGPAGERIVAVLSGAHHFEDRPEGGVRARFQIRSGERCWMVLSWGGGRPEPLAAYRPFEQLRTTRHFWREWARRLTYDGPWRHHVLRAALVLKLLIDGRSGAMIAAPTTSLPECLGGHRNWDYRYTWTRDAALAIRAANLIGYPHEAREFFHFMRDTLDRDAALRVMYTIDGLPVPEEITLPGLRGFADSRPVRIGNGARDQTQLDTAGALVDAAYLHERFGGSLTLRAWRHLRSVIEGVRAGWQEPDHGIWEVRAEKRHNVHSKLMSWVALDRGQRLAPLFGDDAVLPYWQEEALRLHAEVERFGMDASGSHFVSTYGGDEPDATLLLLPVHGFLPIHDPRVQATLDWVRERLSAGPFLYRYRGADGLEGDEGAFVLCGFWLAEALALGGRIDGAQQVFHEHVESSNHLGLLAEEIDPTTRRQLGNFPQAFSHLGLINAAARIDLALRLRDERSSQRPHFVDQEGLFR